MVKSNLPSEKIDYPFEVTTEDRGTLTTITVNPSSLRVDGVVTMVVTYPDGTVSETPITLTFDTQKYFAELDAKVMKKKNDIYIIDYPSNVKEILEDKIFNELSQKNKLLK